MSNDQKIAVCGIACYKCQKFTKEECPGCQPNEFCPLPKCSQEKAVDCCFDCGEFPCSKNYESGPIVKEMLDHWTGKK